jgi:hypothetical protein
MNCTECFGGGSESFYIIYGLFNDAITNSDYTPLNDRINELERTWKEAVRPNSWYYTGICLEGLRETIKKSEQPVSRLRFEPGTSQT